MSELKFAVEEQSLEFLNPFNNFQLERQTLLLRRDPLLGHIAVFNPALAGKARILFGDIDRPWLDRVVEDSAHQCFFCPGRIEATPRYPPELIPEGRIQVGEALLFPNLYALARHHAVVAVCHQHFLELREFTPARVADALVAMQRFLAAAGDEARYATLNANYLFPAGASLVHPHFQLLAGPIPYGQHDRQLEAWRGYHAAHGRSYGEALVASEQQQAERYIGQRGGWHWLTAWAPLGNLEIQAVHTTASHFTDLPEGGVAALAEGISRMLGLYEKLGYISFNFSVFSQPDAAGGAHRLFLRLFTRQNPTPAYRCDDYFLQKLLGADLILMPPEDLARQARETF